MCKIKRFLCTGTLITFLLTACQPLIAPVTPTAESTVQSGTASSTTPLTDTTTLSATVSVTEAAVVSSTETVPASETVTTPDSAAETPTSTAALEESAVSTEPTLTVIVASLRMRSGPGTEYTVLGAAAQGEQYPITGQAYGCQWYQVTHPQLGTVWLSGGAQYVSGNLPCVQVAEIAAPTASTSAPTATAVPVQGQQANNPEPTPSAPPTQSVADPFPADQGCLLLQNQLGPELTFTFTNADGSWRDSIKVNSDQDVPYCLTPGHYRVTVDAPPPWSSLNRDFDIKAGDRAYFPIRPQ